MKISVALAILILVAAAGLGWQNNQRLVTLRKSHTDLIATAASLGISLNPEDPLAAVLITKRERENNGANAKAVATEFIAFAREMEAMQKESGSPDEAGKKRMFEMMERVMALDSAGLKILIAEVRATKDLKDETRQELIGFAIMTLSNDHPQAALALFTESADLLNGEGMSNHFISSSLAKWAKDDPLAALEWVRKNSAKFPDLITDEAKGGLISGAALQDPKLAFKLIGELGIKEVNSAVSEIIRAAKTPEQRTATLNALRDHVANLPDEDSKEQLSKTALTNLGIKVVHEGFEAGSKWAIANLTPTELEAFAGGVRHFSNSGDIGRWIEWIGEKLPAGKGDNKIGNIVRSWTSQDYQAAGKWLTTTPDGPTKNTAIRSYAETVSPYQPETAAQWAMTLPPGNDRDQTLKTIHNNWPKDDPADKEAAAVFAKEHGIKQ